MFNIIISNMHNPRLRRKRTVMNQNSENILSLIHEEVRLHLSTTKLLEKYEIEKYMKLIKTLNLVNDKEVSCADTLKYLLLKIYKSYNDFERQLSSEDVTLYTPPDPLADCHLSEDFQLFGKDPSQPTGIAKLILNTTVNNGSDNTVDIPLYMLSNDEFFSLKSQSSSSNASSRIGYIGARKFKDEKHNSEDLFKTQNTSLTIEPTSSDFKKPKSTNKKKCSTSSDFSDNSSKCKSPKLNSSIMRFNKPYKMCKKDKITCSTSYSSSKNIIDASFSISDDIDSELLLSSSISGEHAKELNSKQCTCKEIEDTLTVNNLNKTSPMSDPSERIEEMEVEYLSMECNKVVTEFNTEGTPYDQDNGSKALVPIYCGLKDRNLLKEKKSESADLTEITIDPVTVSNKMPNLNSENAHIKSTSDIHFQDTENGFKLVELDERQLNEDLVNCVTSSQQCMANIVAALEIYLKIEENDPAERNMLFIQENVFRKTSKRRYIQHDTYTGRNVLKLQNTKICEEIACKFRKKLLENYTFESKEEDDNYEGLNWKTLFN